MVVIIDLKKVFDTIGHNILLIKLKHYGVDDNALTWFHSYLTNRKQKCFVNVNFSDSCPPVWNEKAVRRTCPAHTLLAGRTNRRTTCPLQSSLAHKLSD